MTTPMGDLPDWQTLVTPNILTASILDQTGGLNSRILSLSTPYRLWGVWLSYRFSTNAAYSAGLASAVNEIQDDLGNVILAISGSLRLANTATSGALSLAIPGFTPAPNAGFYNINLVSGVTPANTDFHISGGVYYSSP